MEYLNQGEDAVIRIGITEDDGTAAGLIANYAAIQAAVYGTGGKVYGTYTLADGEVSIADTSYIEFTIPAEATTKMKAEEIIYAELKLTLINGTVKKAGNKKEPITLFTVEKSHAI